MQSDFYSRFLNQTATYWSFSTRTTGGFAKRVFDAPVAISVRWEDTNELFMNARGEEQVSMSIVMIDQDVQEGGYLFLGTSVATDPRAVTDARIIKKFDKTPDIKANKFQRTVFL